MAQESTDLTAAEIIAESQEPATLELITQEPIDEQDDYDNQYINQIVNIDDVIEDIEL